MTEFPKDIKFKYNWRKYQERVLDELQEHLIDNHLHIVAPPGSGKTVLGIEVAIRLNKPTLILVPTIAILNQWIQRFCELFLQTDQTPNWISRDVRNPKFLTVVTYQGLHAACNNLKIEEDELLDEDEKKEAEKINSKNSNLSNIVRVLHSQNIKTIILDEAHHLKNEWWQTITKIKKELNPKIVGLTATPPYDVTVTEWLRYMELNGPIDTEISVPELIIAADLCPHQDYIHFSLPTEKEYQSLVDFRLNIGKLFSEIKEDKTLISAVQKHPFWTKPKEDLDWLYGNISYYCASLIFLNSNNIKIPKSHLDILGYSKQDIPILDYYWIEKLLDFYIYKGKESFDNFEEHQKNIENRLKRQGAIERSQINLSFNNNISKHLTSSISKLSGIKEIVDFEHKQLGNELRLVILTDYIRKDFLVNSSENNLELNQIGVLPIFEKLRRENTGNHKLGVLTGSIVIIPKTALTAFNEKAKSSGITTVESSIIPFDENYILIHSTDKIKHQIVNITTHIFECGEIEVLIGTKSLLGEGWDAPTINSLILASFVGSFVLSNQMRGRAIRTQKENINKTGNIWHLVCVDPTSVDKGPDFALLKRRFRSFIGVSFKDEGGIENGLDRLNIPKSLVLAEEIENKNRETFDFAANRQLLKENWETALKTGVNLVEEIKIPFGEEKEYREIKSLTLRKTILNSIITLSSAVFLFCIDNIKDFLFRLVLNKALIEQLGTFFIITSCLGILYFGRQTYNTIKLYLKYRDISKDIRKIGDALLNTLIKIGVINTDISKLTIETSVDAHGAVYCHLEGGTTYERSIFINSLQEIISPIENPRYVIVRKNRFLNLINQKDYHSVPEIIGRNKSMSEYFKDEWRKKVGYCDLIYTRTLSGRELLLKSRAKALSTQLDNEIEHQNKWR